MHEKLLVPAKDKKRWQTPVPPVEFTAKLEKLLVPKHAASKATTNRKNKVVTKKTVTRKAAVKKKTAARKKTARTV